MAQNEKPVVPAPVMLDDATLDLVTGGLGKATGGRLEGMEAADFAGLQAHAPENTGSHSSDASKAASMARELGAQTAGGDIYAAMSLFQKMAQEMRDTARESRANDMNAQVAALQNAAQEIRDAAQERLAGAMVQGAMQIAGGLGAAGYSSMTGLSIKGMADHTALQAKAGADHSGFSGIAGGALGGIGSIAQASHELTGAGQDAHKAEQEAEAKGHGSAAQQADDLMQQMMDVIRDVREKLGAIEQARQETTRGIARNI